MKKKIIILFIIISITIFGILIFINLKKHHNEENLKRYNEIKNDIDTKLKRYMYVIAPKCEPNGSTPLITHKDLVYNAGMDKDKFLDIDSKSYCKAYIIPTCIEKGIWKLGYKNKL